MIHVSSLITAAILQVFGSAPPTDAASAPTHLFVTRIGPCYDAPDSIVSISEMSIARKAYDFSVSGQINISTNINNGWTVQATMQKCQDIRAMDTCDHFRSFLVVRNGCAEEDDSDALDVYAMIFHHAHPRLMCPIQAGIYRLVDYPFYTEDNYLSVSESKLSTSRFGYTFRLEGFSEDNMVLCIDSVMQLLYIREHNWFGSKTQQGSEKAKEKIERDKQHTAESPIIDADEGV